MPTAPASPISASRPPSSAISASNKRGDRPLVSIWGGGNDILNVAGKARARKEGRQAAIAIGDAAQSLRRGGVSDLMIFDMPDLGEIPKFRDNDDKAASASAASRVFNRQLGKQIDALTAKGVTVYTVSAYDLFNDLLDDPRSFGVTNVTTPCLDEDDNPCTRRQGLRRAFFDEIHPNKRVHAALAEAALDALDGGAKASAFMVAAAAPAPAPVAATPAPVPLPASGLMLVAALGAAGAWVRRRAA